MPGEFDVEALPFLIVGNPAAAHLFVGTDIPTPLLTAYGGGPAFVTWRWVMLWYYQDNASFYYMGVLHNNIFDIDEYVTGTYDNNTGETIPMQYIDGPGAGTTPGASHFGSDLFVGATRPFTNYRSADLQITHTATFISENMVALNGSFETWHTPTFSNGWTATGGQPLQFRLIPGGIGQVQLRGTMTAGTKADGTVAFTLPANYIPASNTDVAVSINSTTAGQSPHIFVNPANGQCSVWGCTAAGLTSVSVQAIFPLD